MPFAARLARSWTLRSRTLTLGPRTLVMGVVNVTPDSFSDGGQWFETEHAIERGLRMLDEGAAILDIGGESTRPGAEPVSAAEEQGRVMPVIRGLLRARPDAVLSIDTYHAETADKALAAGVEIVNDVSGGLWDDAMLPLCAAQQCGVILMHSRGRPHEWRSLEPLPPNKVTPLVKKELHARLDAALAHGLAVETIALDPGFGFGKILDENYPLLAGMQEIVGLGRPVVAGLSRKGFLRRSAEQSLPAAGRLPVEALRDATIAGNTAAILGGAHVIRVHDVLAGVCATAIADAVLSAAETAREMP